MSALENRQGVGGLYSLPGGQRHRRVDIQLGQLSLRVDISKPSNPLAICELPRYYGFEQDLTSPLLWDELVQAKL